MDTFILCLLAVIAGLLGCWLVVLIGQRREERRRGRAALIDAYSPRGEL